MGKEKNLKTSIAPNECSLKRWIAVILLGVLLGFVFLFPVILALHDGMETFMGTPVDVVTLLLPFITLFFGFVLSLKLVGKTSLKAFVLGTEQHVSRKSYLTLIILLFVGILLSCLPDLHNISPRSINYGDFFLMTLFLLLTLWMQTTLEELLFRGVFLRWTCKNNIGYTKKAFIACLVSTVLFALIHCFNTEVTSLRGLEIIPAICSYAIPGFAYYLVDMHYGSLLPGILLHWANNFVLAIMFSDEVASIHMPALLTVSGTHSGLKQLLSSLLCYIPVLLYILLDVRKNRSSASSL